jgi:hypothetical protein
MFFELADLNEGVGARGDLRPNGAVVVDLVAAVALKDLFIPAPASNLLAYETTT